MSHVDPDQLALLALGEPVTTDEERDHLASCAQCAAELAEMRRTVTIARSTIGEEQLETPPAAVWTRIQDELGLAAATPGAEESPAAEPTGDEPAGEVAAQTRRRSPRRGIRRLWVLAASLVLIAVVGVGTWSLVQRSAPVSIAQASLDAFPDHAGATGTADVEESRDGARTLVVTLEGGAEPDTYREVWLIRNDAGALISLGVLTGERGSFPIPEGLDLTQYRLVDVSVEAIDGDPGHSGDSIVRGELDFV